MIGWLGERTVQPEGETVPLSRNLHARIEVERGGFRLEAELTAPPGVTAVFGPSGAGKTTLLRALAGLQRAVRGRIIVAGDTWLDSEAEIELPAWKRAVGYVFQDANLLPHRTVLGNLQFGRRRSGGPGPGWDDVIEWLELEPLLPRSPSSLSGGERQRVALARALVRRPRVLLLDEPVSSLDEPARREILHYLERLPRRYTVPIVLVTHNLEEVVRLAEQVVWIDAGRLRAQGTVTEVAADLDFARWRGEDAGVVVEGDVLEHDDVDHLTELQGPWGRILVRRQEELAGARVRIRVLARDVSLALEAEPASTILNQFAMGVRSIEDFGPGEVLVRLGRDEGPDLLARVTRRSVAKLRLEPGASVYARVKSVALLS